MFFYSTFGLMAAPVCFWLTTCVLDFWIIDLKWCFIFPLITSRAWQTHSELVLTFAIEYSHIIWGVNPKGLTAERGWEGARVVAWPQVDFSERLQSCLIPSSHGNRRLWCTWPTYVLYVHKHTLTICYCCFVHRLVGTLSDCQMSLWEITRTNREARSCFHHFWEAVNALRQQWLQVTLRQAALLCLQ